MNTTFKISLDVHKLESQTSITAFKGDSGYTIIATFTENGKPLEFPETCGAVFSGVKPDGNLLYNECVIDNGRVIYDFKSTIQEGETCQTTAAVGVVKCQFKLYGENGGIIASPQFNIVVIEPAVDESEIHDTSVTEVNKLTNLVADIETRLNNGEFKGDQGDQGEKGADGHTPVKGVDYYTEAEKEELVQEVLSESGGGTGGSGGNPESMIYPVNEQALMRLADVQKDVTDKADTFLYFTDPHLCEGSNWKDEFDAYAKNIEETFKRSGASFIVCGGDWLGDGDTRQEACYKLAYANSRMKAITPNFYFVVGNHDTNYQGIEVDDNLYDVPAPLNNQTIGNIVNNGEKNYYYFKHNRNTYFVLDTGSDQNHTTLNNYDREQVQFFVDTVADLYENGNLGRVFVFAHCGWLSDGNGGYFLHPLIRELRYVNDSDSSQYDPVDYFEGCAMKDHIGGFFCGVFAGHIHAEKDYNSDNENGEPVIIARDQLRSGGTPTFDIVVTHNSDIGYGGANIKITNFGNGSDKHYQGGDY